MRGIVIGVVVGFVVAVAAVAQHGGHEGHDSGHSAPAPETRASSATVVWQVTGMHCAPCVTAVEKAIKGVSGVRKAAVSLQDGTAEVSYEGDDPSLQATAQAIAAAPSPMPDGEFAAALLLRVKGLRSDRDADRLSAALEETKGIRKADVLLKPGAAILSLEAKPPLRLSDVASAADEAGFAISPLSAKDARKLKAKEPARSAPDSGGHGGHGGGGGSGHGCGGCG